MELLRLLIRKSACYIDIGANVGRYAWFMTQNAGTDLRIYAFEPNPRAADLLRTALAGGRNVEIFTVALAESDRKSVLRVPRDAHGNPVSALGWIDGAGAPESVGEHNIECRALDSLIAAGEVVADRPLFLKIDVEGAELSVLEGARELLAHVRPALYFECEAPHLERAGRSPDALWEFLTDAGYRIFREDGETFRHAESVHKGISNYFAISFALEDDPKTTYTAMELAEKFGSDI